MINMSFGFVITYNAASQNCNGVQIAWQYQHFLDGFIFNL